MVLSQILRVKLWCLHHSSSSLTKLMRIGIIHYKKSNINIGKLFLILGTAWQQGIGTLRPAPFPSASHVPGSCLWHEEPCAKLCLSAPQFFCLQPKQYLTHIVSCFCCVSSVCVNMLAHPGMKLTIVFPLAKQTTSNKPRGGGSYSDSH